MLKDLETNQDLKEESFYGLYHFLARENLSENRIDYPIVIIIKNLSTFPSPVLNDLIHLIKKYRDKPYNLKLSLVIGRRNNNENDEILTRVSMRNSVKMTVKKF